MTDSKLLAHIKLLQKELDRRYGNKPCKAVAIGCANCQKFILDGYLQEQMDLLDWGLKRK